MGRQRHILFILFFLFGQWIVAQSTYDKYAGVYSDGYDGKSITELILKKDSTFVLTTQDNIFPKSFNSYRNEGKWIKNKNIIILNPHLQKRAPKVELIEHIQENEDSIVIKINYHLQTYENGNLINTTKCNFETLTIYLNRKKKYHNLVRHQNKRYCLLAP